MKSRTIYLNYAALENIYKQRGYHKLDEWFRTDFGLRDYHCNGYLLVQKN